MFLVHNVCLVTPREEQLFNCGAVIPRAVKCLAFFPMKVPQNYKVFFINGKEGVVGDLHSDLETSGLILDLYQCNSSETGTKVVIWAYCSNAGCAVLATFSSVLLATEGDGKVAE